jgi:hypothetical protein
MFLQLHNSHAKFRAVEQSPRSVSCVRNDYFLEVPGRMKPLTAAPTLAVLVCFCKE